MHVKHGHLENSLKLSELETSLSVRKNRLSQVLPTIDKRSTATKSENR